MPPDNVLIIRLSAIGDVAMAVPVVYSACRTYPHTKFYFLTRASIAPIFINPPENLVLIPVDLSKFKGILGIRRLARQILNNTHFRSVIDIHNVIRSRLLTLFLRTLSPRIKIYTLRKQRARQKVATRKANKKLTPLTPRITLYEQTFRRAGFELSSDSFQGLFKAHSTAPVSLFHKILFDCSLLSPSPSSIWIAVAPFAAHPQKIYPPALMRTVVDALAALPSSVIFLLGGGDHEKSALESWADSRHNIISLAGKKYGFPAEIALINHCRLLIAMDSANMHLAALASTPVISIWGATHPRLGFVGFNPALNHIIQCPLSCRPCSVYGARPCRLSPNAPPPCLLNISPDIIIKKALDILNTVRQ